MNYDVIRNFGIDYIFFDIAFLMLFIFLLIKSKKKIPLMFLFIGGIINFLIDWGVWYNLSDIREISVPDNFLPFLSFGLKVFIFFLWFSISYGLEYAWVFLMFDKNSKKLKWTIILFAGWILVGLLSQLLPLNDAQITTIRHMPDLRIWRVIIVVAGYTLLVLLKYKWKTIAYLFFIGFTIHFMMEFSLLITGIRPGSFSILLENSLIEFNMGIPILYLIYDKLFKKKTINNS
jgi:hypothetical protein